MDETKSRACACCERERQIAARGLCQACYQRLWAAGNLDAHAPQNWRPWSDDERQTAVELLATGASLRLVARKVGRTIPAILRQLHEHDVTVVDTRKRHEVYSARQVARVFGVDVRCVELWLRQGWLRAQRNGADTLGKPRQSGVTRSHRTKRPYYLVGAEALYDFALVRESWPFWEPERIVDASLRTHALEARAAAGGAWLSLADVAARLYYSHTRVREWAQVGLLPARRIVDRWFVWSADLVDFVPPFVQARRTA